MKTNLYRVAEDTRQRIHPETKAPTLFAAALTKVVRVVAEGDSWFSYWPPDDIVTTLRKGPWPGRRYDIAGRPAAGAYLNDMVYHPRQLAETFQAIRMHQPEVLIFSGGGNDIAGPELFDFLWNKNAGGSGPPRIMNASVLNGVVHELFEQAYRDFIAAVRDCAADVGIAKLPVVIHGYDYAIPDGRGWMGGWGPLPGPWLDPSLRKKHWHISADAAMRRDAIHQLIDALNGMMQRLEQTVADVHHVDLRGTLLDSEWDNELHPTDTGFKKVTDVIERRLRAVVP